MTTRRMLLVGLGILCCVALVGSVLVLADMGSRRAAAVAATVVPTGIAVPADEAPDYEYIAEPAERFDNPGVPAIRLPSGSSGLTLEDVAAYLKAYPHPYAKDGTVASVVGFECSTIGDINDRLHSNIPAAKATRACLVTFEGEFAHDAGVGGELITGDFGYQVFDAATGNLYSTQFKNSELHPIP